MGDLHPKLLAKDNTHVYLSRDFFTFKVVWHAAIGKTDYSRKRCFIEAWKETEDKAIYTSYGFRCKMVAGSHINVLVFLKYLAACSSLLTPDSQLAPTCAS